MKTNYSRRELYALGEPLGNSATYRKATGGYVLGGGGGGGNPAPAPTPTQTTVQNTNVPEYAQPYVEQMLGAAQQQIFNYAPDSSGNMVATGIKPYTPYSNNPQDYVAGFSPLQQQAQSNIANMQVPGQYGAASQAAGLGSAQALTAGQRYNMMATNPYAVGAFMNPFIENTLAPAQQLLNQQYGMQGAQQAGQATSSGAFGGTRGALMQGLNEQNRMLAQNQLVGNAYNQAYNNAMQNMQYGAGLGLQGAQAGITGANTLANIGNQQYQTALGINQAQEAAGAAQQAQQQNIINQQIQNYATAQQYPMLQLANMSSLLRGLPMQSATTQTYQAAPSAVSQLGGLGATALGAYGAAGGFKGAKGGLPKDFEKVKKFNVGGAAKADLYQLAETDQGLDKVRQEAVNSPSQEIRNEAKKVLAQKALENQALGSVAPTFNAASGGIVAFAGKDESLVKSSDTGYFDPESGEYVNEAPVQRKGFFANIAEKIPGYGQGLTTDPLANNPEAKAALQKTIAPAQTSAPTTTGTGPTFDKTAGGNPAVANLNKPAGIGATPEAGYTFSSTKEDKDYQTQVGKIGTQIDKLTEELNKGLKSGKSQADLDDLREEIKDKQNQKLWMSLMAGGAKAMASTSPYAGVGIGQGIGAGIETYAQAKKDELADKKLLIAQQSALEQAEYARKTGNLNALIAAQSRLDSIKMHRDSLRAQYAGISASKEAALEAAKQKTYAENYTKYKIAGMSDQEAEDSARAAMSGYANLGKASTQDKAAVQWFKTAKVGDKIPGGGVVTQDYLDKFGANLKAKGLV